MSDREPVDHFAKLLNVEPVQVAIPVLIEIVCVTIMIGCAIAGVIIYATPLPS